MFALHLLVAVALPLADAGVEATAAVALPDVQLRGVGDDAPDQRTHDHMACQFCRVLGQGAVTVAGTARSAGPPGPAALPSSAVSETFPSTASPLPLGSRAPPQA